MGTTIHVALKDRATLQVSSEDSGVLMELTEFFSFMAPGYAFMPAYRNRMWDGKIRIFNGRNNTLPSGLLHHLAEFAKSRGYELKLGAGILIPGTYASYACAMPKVPLTYNGKSLEIRDYQFAAVSRGMQDHQALLVSPTGSGKSLIIYLLIRWFLSCNQDVKSPKIIEIGRAHV